MVGPYEPALKRVKRAGNGPFFLWGLFVLGLAMLPRGFLLMGLFYARRGDGSDGDAREPSAPSVQAAPKQGKSDHAPPAPRAPRLGAAKPAQEFSRRRAAG